MTITSKFDGKCKACGGNVKAGALVNWERGYGITHRTSAECAAAKAASEAERAVRYAAAPVVMLTSVVEFLKRATKGNKPLKFPRAHFLAPNNRDEVRLSLAGSGSSVPGSVQVYLNESWLGRVEPNGKVIGRLAGDEAMLAHLSNIANDPAKAAKEYGALRCSCSFCLTPLTDEGSIEVGYGPICAARYELPHTPKGSKALKAVPVIEPTAEQVEEMIAAAELAECAA